MNFYAPPNVIEVVSTTAIGLAIFNLICLIISIIWWAHSDRCHLRSTLVDLKLYSPDDVKQSLAKMREHYFYYQTLPLFVERSPLRIAMHRSSAPSLGPVLAVLAVQSIPGISLFVGFWYAIHGAWHIGYALLGEMKTRTPAPIKRLLFTAWF
jgi:hypothetical protein